MVHPTNRLLVGSKARDWEMSSDPRTAQDSATRTARSWVQGLALWMEPRWVTHSASRKASHSVQGLGLRSAQQMVHPTNRLLVGSKARDWEMSSDPRTAQDSATRTARSWVQGLALWMEPHWVIHSASRKASHSVQGLGLRSAQQMVHPTNRLLVGSKARDWEMNSDPRTAQ